MRLASLISIAVLSAVHVGGTLAGAQPQTSRAQRPHLLVVPSTPEGRAALAGGDVRVVARYGAFTLVEASGADDERLRAAGAERRDDMRRVRTAAGRLDPRTQRRSLAGKQAPERDEVLALVQFVGPPKDAWLRRLRSTGARIVSYQAENAYVVHASGAQVDRLAALVGVYAPVRAVSPLTAADKLESRRSASGLYAVQTISGAVGEEARDDIAAAGTGVSRPVSLRGLRTQYLALGADDAAELAADPAVVAVEPYSQPQLADERGAQIVAGNLSGFAPGGPGYLDWLVDDARIPNDDSFGFAIDVTDEGLDGGGVPPEHPDFLEQGIGASRVAYRNNYSSDADTRDCRGHGTNVASIAAGYNAGTGAAAEDSAGFNHGLGVAPFARVGTSKIFLCDGGAATGWTPAGLADAAYEDSARISNNSWGTSSLSAWGAYSTRAQQYDAVVRDADSGTTGNQGMVEVFAAGNDGEGAPGGIPEPDEGYGTIMAEATAKNVITVGAAEGVRASGTDGCGTPNASADNARDIADFSARGPTDDGRLKPDLVAPGTHVTGARPRHGGYTGDGTCGAVSGGGFYSLISGSSQAAPHVSGAAALVRHWYERTEAPEPSPALIKALLINTATDLAGGSTGQGATIAGGPNTDQGWGRVSIGSALDSTPREYRDQELGETFGDPGESFRWTYAAQNEQKPVKITLVWTDAPGSVTGDAWVNNLDLEVEAQGQRFLGNVFDGAFSRVGGSPDTRNNVESVYLPAGSTDRFTVTVRSIAVGGDAVPGIGDTTDQDFALVVSNADEQDAPVLVHSATTVDDSVGGDNDEVLESGEQVELTEEVRNAGNADGEGMSGTFTGGGGLNVTQPASAYPDLAPDDTGSNSTAFEAGLANASVCGSDVPATLDITTTETHRIPLVLATGEAGPSLASDALGLPVAIPDNSGPGVSSSVFVTARGRIKDLNLRLPGSAANPAIDHGWVGDLVIDLIGPDGTTVRLADHPGGPDNSGKDFRNVVFDDEASLRLGEPAGPPPYNGSFKPQNDQLSRFDGKDRRGTWTLRVRDLFESESGSLRAWGITSRRAVCDFDMSAPQTRLLSGPAATTGDTSPTFSFDSPDDPGAMFECRLDGADYEPCGSPKTYGSLAYGAHSFQVRAVDGSGNEDATPVSVTWTIADTLAPVVTLTRPVAGSSTADATPAIAGVAGAQPGDGSAVTLKIWTGTLAAGLPTQTLIVPRDAASGAFSAVAAVLADGTYTVRAEQRDSAANTGLSKAVTFGVDTSVPAVPPAGFVVAPAEERTSDALANRYTVLAACDSACEIDARLSVSAAAARKLGLKARPVAIGAGAERLVTAGSAAVRVGLTATARDALRRRGSSSATLNVVVREAGEEALTLRRAVTLRRSGALARVIRRGLRLWTVCSKKCALRGSLGISARGALKLGLEHKGTKRMTIASGRTTGGRAPRRLTLKVPSTAKSKLRAAKRLKALLEATAGSAARAKRSASRRLTLR